MGYVIRSTDKGSLNGIRHLVYANLAQDDLPDDTIDNSVFVRAAELQAYKLLSISNDQAYASMSGLTSYLVEPRVRFPKTILFVGQWTANQRYDVNTIVYQGDTLYLSKSVFMAGSTFNTSNWDQIPVQFRGNWAASTSYLEHDIVNDGGRLYFKNATGNSNASFTASLWTRIDTITQSASEILFEEQTKLAIQYLAAIRIIPALPQLLEEQILRERIRYQEIDWEKRIELYETEATDALDSATDAHIFASGTAIFGEVKQYVAF